MDFRIKAVSFMLALFMLISGNLVAAHDVDHPSNVVNIAIDFISDISDFDEFDLDELSCGLIKLVSPLESCWLVTFESFTSQVGYAIVSESRVIEASRNISPYHNILNEQDFDLYYHPGFYGVKLPNGVHSIEDFEEIFLSSESLFYHEIPGINPKKQVGKNCQAAAVANLLWYWGEVKYPDLIRGRTFYQIQYLINGYLIDLGGNVRRNDDIPQATELYLKSVSSQYYVSGSVQWSPTYQYVTSEIDRGYPLLLGFKANGPYDGGHMTMCYGHYLKVKSKYVIVADGHVTYGVHYEWSSFNDCAIRLRPLKYGLPDPGIDPEFNPDTK